MKHEKDWLREALTKSVGDLDGLADPFTDPDHDIESCSQCNPFGHFRPMADRERYETKSHPYEWVVTAALVGGSIFWLIAAFGLAVGLIRWAFRF